MLENSFTEFLLQRHQLDRATGCQSSTVGGAKGGGAVPTAATWATAGAPRAARWVVASGYTSGTYIPSPNMLFAIIEGMGGGGSGGGAQGGGGVEARQGGGGGGGSYSRSIRRKAHIAVAGVAVTIGAGGAAPAAGANGISGGTTSVAGVLTAPGGSGGHLLRYHLWRAVARAARLAPEIFARPDNSACTARISTHRNLMNTGRAAAPCGAAAAMRRGLGRLGQSRLAPASATVLGGGAGGGHVHCRKHAGGAGAKGRGAYHRVHLVLKMVPIPTRLDYLAKTAPHWLPFISRIAHRSKETVPSLLGMIKRLEVQLIMAWDEQRGQSGGADGRAALDAQRRHDRRIDLDDRHAPERMATSVARA